MPTKTLSDGVKNHDENDDENQTENHLGSRMSGYFNRPSSAETTAQIEVTVILYQFLIIVFDIIKLGLQLSPFCVSITELLWPRSCADRSPAITS